MRYYLSFILLTFVKNFAQLQLGIPMISITCLNNNDLSAMSKYNLYFQSSTMDKDMNINRSSYLTLHLILHLLYDGYIDYATCKI